MRRCSSTARRRVASASTSRPAPRPASSPARAARCGSSPTPAPVASSASMARSTGRCEMATSLSRTAYAAMFGPTTGDRLRLADTELVIEIEADRTIYGEEVKFGGGKVIRDGMGQGQATRADGAVDTVITNAVIVDHWGIVKADIGIREIGRAHV